MGEVTGIELNEEVDLALEFSKDPSKYSYSDWSLVQMEEITDASGSSERAVKTVLYLQTVKRTSPYLKYSDAMSDIGGFCVFISAVLGVFVNCVNEKIYRKLLVHDSYKVKFNKDYLCIPDIKPKASERFEMFSKKKNKPATAKDKDTEKDKDKDTEKDKEKEKLKEVAEDKDKSDGETAAEGGDNDGNFIIEMGDDEFEGGADGDNVS